MALSFKLKSTLDGASPGFEKLIQKAVDIDRGLKDYTIPLKESAADIKVFTQTDVFDTEGGALGNPWKKLSDNYGLWKQANYPGMKKLQLTRTMKQKFKIRSGKRKATVFNTDKKFPWHQLGTSRMPQRQSLGINSKVVNLVEDRFENYLNKLLEKS